MIEKIDKIEKMKEKISTLQENLSQDSVNKTLVQLTDILKDLISFLDSMEVVVLLGEEHMFDCPICEEEIPLDPTAFMEKEWIRLRCDKCGEMIFISHQQ
ncbi:MAG: hypothetical protein DDT23_00391 [candidate division WS2 bacterium]|nr:hypothetical protein [Candidatus Lithacetigena glycinireducens]